MKKILYALILLSVFMAGNVKAAKSNLTCAPVSPTLEILETNSKEESMVEIYINDSTVKTGYFYKQKINGKYALCLDLGGRSSSRMAFTATKMANSDLSFLQKYAAIKSLNFIANHPSDDIAYVVAQIGLWSTMANSTGLLNSTNFHNSVVSAYCEVFSYTYSRNGCSIGEKGYKDTEETYSKIITNYVNEYMKLAVTDVNNTNYAVYSSTSPNAQRLISLYKCDPPGEYTCPDGTMSTNVTTCVENKIKNGYTKTQALAACQTEICPSTCKYGTVVQGGYGAACVSNSTNYGKYYEMVDFETCGTATEHGEPEKVINEHCKLYCLETSAQQIFPGNVKPAVSTGTYIIWPTSDATISSIYGNKYPLKFSGQKECYVEVDPNTENKLNSLFSQAESKNAYGQYAKQYYSSSRKGENCNAIYENVCGVLDKQVKKLQSKLNSLESSYKSAIAHRDTINACESEKAECNRQKDACESAYNECHSERSACENRNSAIEKAKSRTCSRNPYASICSQKTETCRSCPSYNCISCNSYNCGSLSTAERNVIKEYEDTKKELDNVLSKLNACKAEHSACNSYASAVKKIVDMANRLKTCATYSSFTCSGSTCELYDFGTHVDLSWTDDEYGKVITDSQLEKNKNYSFNIEGNQPVNTNVNILQTYSNIKNNSKAMFNEVKAIIQKRKLVMHADVTYSLPTSNLIYNYVIKNKNGSILSQTSKPSSNLNYTTIGYSNLPVSVNASPLKTYNLKLTNVSFGDNGGQYHPSDYVCKYNVTKTPSSSCLCPTGTTYEGKNLFTIMVNENLKCSDAQAKYCNSSGTNYACPNNTKVNEMTNCMNNEYKDDYFACYDKYCTSSVSNYCPSPYENINLTPCLDNGFSYNYCYNKFCKDPGDYDDGYHCKNTNGVDGKMDITSCVVTKMSQGLNVQQAIDECDALICPIGGLRIIYRTISLENPFPGRNITKVANGFNDNVVGRYPGTNWNNINLVKNHILTVKRQGVTYDGSDIYQKAEPLYTFELTTTTINAIRKYNESQLNGYADFTLDCKKSNSTACVSSFVHNKSLSGLVSGVCANAVSVNNFYTCSGD